MNPLDLSAFDVELIRVHHVLLTCSVIVGSICSLRTGREPLRPFVIHHLRQARAAIDEILRLAEEGAP